MKKLNLVVLLAGGLYSTYGMASVDCTTVPTGETLIYCDEFERTGINFDASNTFSDFAGVTDFNADFPGTATGGVGVVSIEVGGSRTSTSTTANGVDAILLNNASSGGIYNTTSSSTVSGETQVIGLWGADGGAPRSGETIAFTFSAKDATSGNTYSSVNVGLDVVSAFLYNNTGIIHPKYPKWANSGVIDVALFAGDVAPTGAGSPADSEAIATGTITGGLGKLNNIDFARNGVALAIANPEDLDSNATVTLMLSVNAENTGIDSGSATADLPDDPSIYGTGIKAYALIDNLKMTGLPGTYNGANEADDATAPVPTTSLLSLLGLVGLLGFVIRRQVKK